MRSVMKAIASACMLALAASSVAYAQATTAAGTFPDIAKTDAGRPKDVGVTALIGRDSGTHLKCTVGSADTCIIPGGGSGGGGGTVTGTSSNATDGQATSTANIGSDSYNYGWNGTTWDRLKETSGQLQVLNYGAGGLFAQGTAAAGTTSLNVYIGGSVAQNVLAASGSYVSGSVADGALVTVGTKADTANCATGQSEIACIRQLHTDLVAATPAGSASIGTVGLNAGTNFTGYVGVGGTTASTNALTNYKLVTSALATTVPTSVKTTAGRVYGGQVYNAAASVRYLKLYNKNSAPTVGTDTPTLTLALAPGVTNLSQVMAADIGVYFGVGIAFAFTVGVTDTDATALTAGDITVITLLYQ